MKTLIFNGSPRKNGETAYMIRTLQENLGGLDYTAIFDVRQMAGKIHAAP